MGPKWRHRIDNSGLALLRALPRAARFEMPTKYVPVAGVATHFLYSGTSTLPPSPPRYDHGEALLFLHGAGGNAGVWGRQMRHFGGSRAAIALDFPGHGRSGGTEGLGSIAVYADFTQAFAEAIDLPPAVVVGVCMGGAIGLELAMARTRWVRALVLVNSSARPRFRSLTVQTWSDVAHGLLPQPFTPDAFSPSTDFALMREMWMEQVKTDPRVRWTDMLACNEYDATPRLGEVAVPVLVVAGGDDAVVPLADVEALRDAIPGARLRVLGGAGHSAPAEQSEAFNAAVDEFVAGLPPGGS